MKLAPNHRTWHRCSLAALGAAACLLVAGPLTAQDDDDDHADALTHQADRVAATPSSWSEAARMHRQAGMLRRQGDMRSYVSFVHAARLFYHAGELRDSEEMFEAAGDRAREAGDVYNAAIAYFSAAMVADENGRAREAQELGWRGQKLARSDKLNVDQRDDLSRRFTVIDGPGKRY